MYIGNVDLSRIVTHKLIQYSISLQREDSAIREEYIFKLYIELLNFEKEGHARI